MGISVEVKVGNYDEIKNDLVERFNIEDVDFLEKILLEFGEKFGECYILLNNEYYDDYNSYYGISEFIDKYYGVEDSFNTFLYKMKEANGNRNVYDVAGELDVELPDDEDE